MSSLSCSTQDLLLRGANSLLWHVGFSLVVAHRLQWVQAQELQHMGSLVVAHRLRCPMACGILVPHQGIKLRIGRRILNHQTTREVLRNQS